MAHNELSRLAVAKGDFDTAVKEMKVSLNLTPDGLKSQVTDLIARLERKVDINR